MTAVLTSPEGKVVEARQLPEFVKAEQFGSLEIPFNHEAEIAKAREIFPDPIPSNLTFRLSWQMRPFTKTNPALVPTLVFEPIVGERAKPKPGKVDFESMDETALQVYCAEKEITLRKASPDKPLRKAEILEAIAKAGK